MGHGGPLLHMHHKLRCWLGAVGCNTIYVATASAAGVIGGDAPGTTAGGDGTAAAPPEPLVPAGVSPALLEPGPNYNLEAVLQVLALRDIPSFIKKLFQLLHDARFHDFFEWADDGAHFGVYNHRALTASVLPTLFKQRHFQSFLRQLNIYGFQRVHPRDAPAEIVRGDGIYFTHTTFRRYNHDALSQIRRRELTKGQAAQAKLQPLVPAGVSPALLEPGPNYNLEAVLQVLALRDIPSFIKKLFHFAAGARWRR
ncbi:hypothetical protein AMAG_17852 [Allomyces macrogynus ATCC 38327]|uniref:HSF-type DNA-binding domain-containing protein n=1 Tax=Allomyces macrogynus (strain ATCC 38327) TaxID=578462 RepID=A0A0L0S0V3_ALLM3|nr:hypothetical protein AMAG_17852 [Allomyces macrogynus ATCC 38327]|eukprot:KNE55969.1 hypothetical protein AMAG_17852 [Allomyces macrogynus ATCC 38327]